MHFSNFTGQYLIFRVPKEGQLIPFHWAQQLTDDEEILYFIWKWNVTPQFTHFTLKWTCFTSTAWLHHLKHTAFLGTSLTGSFFNSHTQERANYLKSIQGKVKRSENLDWKAAHSQYSLCWPPGPRYHSECGGARGASRSLTTGAESLAAVTERLAHLPQGVKPDSAQLPVLPAQFKPFQRALEGWGEQ